MTAKLSKKTGLPRPIETTGRTWQLLIAGEILRTMRECGLPTPHSQLGQRPVMTWRYHPDYGNPAHCCLRITVRDPGHEVPIEIGGGGLRPFYWRPGGENLWAAHFVRMQTAIGRDTTCGVTAQADAARHVSDFAERTWNEWKEQQQ